jgi:hypothetical protein
MDSKNKQRSPQSVKLINELESEFSTIVKDSPSTIMLESKMQNFINLIQEKTMSRCNNQIAELDKYTSTEELNGETKLRSQPGKEAEAQKALVDLQECQAPLSNYMLALNMFSQYNLSLISSSANLCLDDCEIKNSDSSDSDLKNCFRNCYENTYKYTLRSAENLLNLQIDTAMQELSKL